MYKNRVEKTQNILINAQIDGLFVTNPINVFYMSGFKCNQYKTTQPINDPEAFLFITQKDAFLLTDTRYAEIAKSNQFFDYLELPYPTSAKSMVKDIFSEIIEKGSRIAFEESNITFKDLVDLKNFLKGFRTIDGSKIITKQRLIKDPKELKLLKKAAEVTSGGFEYALEKLKQGMTEKELAAEIKMFFLKNADGISFEPVVAFRESSAIPHYTSSDKKIEGEGILLIDLGCDYKGYCGDMTRTVYIGKADDKFKKIYNTVLKTQQAALKSIKAGLAGIEVDKMAREFISKEGFGEKFTHGLGHGLGLQIHEAPYLKTYEKPLENGVVFSVEPGIYIPGYGGVRIEDIIYLQNGKTVNITKTDKKLLEITL